MQKISISPSVLSGSVAAPPSQADAIRLIWASCLGEGGAIASVPDTPAIRDMLSLGKQLGCDIAQLDDRTDILAAGPPSPPRLLSCSTPLVAKFASTLCLQYDGEISISCPALPKRAVAFATELAVGGGGSLSYSEGKLKARGPAVLPLLSLTGLEGAYWSSSFSMSVPLLLEETFFQIDDFVAVQPELHNTLSVLDAFGIAYSFDQAASTMIIAGEQIYPHRMLDAEGDWRNGSYLAGALFAAGSGRISGLSKYSSQHEHAAWAPLEDAGLLSWDEEGEMLSVKGGSLPSVPIDPRPAPALIPLWMSLALISDTPISIGPLAPLSPLSQKRIDIMTDRLQTLGATVERLAENVIVHPSTLHGGEVDASGDARVAMALAIAALSSREGVDLANLEGVEKACPAFWNALRSLGADITGLGDAADKNSISLLP